MFCKCENGKHLLWMQSTAIKTFAFQSGCCIFVGIICLIEETRKLSEKMLANLFTFAILNVSKDILLHI